MIRTIDLGLRIRVFEDYNELMTENELLINNVSKINEVKRAILTVQGKITEMTTAQGNISTQRKLQREIREEMKPMRKIFLTYILGRDKLSDDEEALLEDSFISKQIFTLMSIVATIEQGNGFRIGDEIDFAQLTFFKELIKQYLNVLFLSYEKKEKDGIWKAKQKLNEFMMRMDTEQVEKIVQALDEQYRRNLKSYFKGYKGNKETVNDLLEGGYKKKLFSEGIELFIKNGQSITPEHKRDTIIKRSWELVDIAMFLGIKDVDGRTLTADYAQELDTYEKAVKFAKYIKGQIKGMPENYETSIVNILDHIKTDEARAVENVDEQEFKVTIKKDFLNEACAGVGVPGCLILRAFTARCRSCTHARQTLRSSRYLARIMFK